jgi:hypothetical protein
MRAPRHRTLVPVAAMAASTVLFACHRGDSILLIEVAGDLRLQPTSFVVTVEPNQAAERTFQVAPKSGSTVTLPTSLSIEMAPNLTGPITVTVSASDINGFMIAYGSTTQTDINVGGETILVVTLTSNLPPPVDAGTDAVTGAGGIDASGAAGVGGAGVAGSGGAAGGGMAGRPGTGGASGAAGTGTGGVAGIGGKAGTSGAGGATGTGGTGGIGGKPGTGGAGGAGGRGTGGGTGTGGAAGSGTDAGGPVDAGGDA